MIPSQVYNQALDLALERQLGHLFDVMFQGVDDPHARLERLKSGLRRAEETYSLLVRELAMMDEL